MNLHCDVFASGTAYKVSFSGASTSMLDYWISPLTECDFHHQKVDVWFQLITFQNYFF